MAEPDLMQLFAGLAAGALGGMLGGLLAGLAGIGGGLIYMPVFFACLPHDGGGVPLAVFLSLLAIVLTGGFSARAHYRLGHIDRHAAGQLLPGLLTGGALGLMFTLHLPEALLLAGLALLDAWIAWDYGRPLRHKKTGPQALWPAAAPIGFLSGALGIGGGTMLAPLLRRSLELRRAVGTSALCGTLMAAGALLVNTLLVPSWHALLGAHIWFILGALSSILLLMPPAARYGARLHSRLGAGDIQLLLRAVFALLCLILLLAAAVQYTRAT